MSNDLISRQAAIEALEKEQAYYSHEDGVEIFYEYNHAIKALKNLPSAQPEIIRCKECKHRPKYDGPNRVVFPDEICPCQCDDWYYNWIPSDDWFCANGEGK